MAGGRQVSGLTDLLVRFVSAIAMAIAASAALWFGGAIWIAFVVLAGGIVMWEYNMLVRGFKLTPLAEIAWLVCGAAYVGTAAVAVVQVRLAYDMVTVLAAFLLPIVAVDVGAYFAGRTIGGPKIAPSISPSKTWAGLGGGALAAAVVALGVFASGLLRGSPGLEPFGIGLAIVVGILIAVVAQAGDFFESWMKRRAKVKDSSNLIPGHGGAFDRLDGFIAVYFVVFCVAVAPGFMG